MEIFTLSDAWTQNVGLQARCARGRRPGMKSIPECHYRVALNVETLLCTRGRDFPLSMLPERLRCPRCGWRRMTVALSFPRQPQINAAALAVER